jgi:hypothetical protein
VASSLAPLHEWRNGALSTIDRVYHVDVNANYATFDAFNDTYTLFRRDLATGADVTIFAPPAQPGVVASVAPNGDVAFMYTSIYRWRNGVTTLASNGLSYDPVTDGVNVVYWRWSSSEQVIAVHDGMTETVLASGTGVLTQRFVNYDANGGWTAFTKPTGGVLQVWLRSPTGQTTQRSSAGVSCQINAIGDDGTVVFKAGSQRFLVTASGTPVNVASALGTVVWREGSFYQLVGNSVLRIAQ